MRFQRLIGVGALVGAVALAGCGSTSKKVAASSGNSGSTAASVASTASSASAGSAGTQAASTTGAATTVKASSVGGGDVCTIGKNVSKSLSQNATSGSTSSFKDSFAAAKGALNSVIGQLPSDLKADGQTVKDYFDKIDALYAKYNYDISKIIADPQGIKDATALADDPKFKTASDHLQAYFDSKCGTTGTT